MSANPTWPCWCATTQWLRCWRTDRFGLIRCQSCGTFRIDPPPLEVDGDAAAFYTDYYSSRPNAAATATAAVTRGSRFWIVAAAVPALEIVRERVADIGCGEGQLCGELEAAGWPTIVGVDVSSTRISRARRRYPGVEFYDRPLDQTGVPEASFDLIVMDNVIEHLPEPARMVAGLARYLKPGGQLVVITPNMQSGNFQLLGRRWTPELAPHAHVFLFTAPSLGQLLSRAGLHVDTIGSFHLKAYSVRAWLARLLSGDVKGALWRAGQELGGVYGRLIGKGPMLYAVASIPRTRIDDTPAGIAAAR